MNEVLKQLESLTSTEIKKLAFEFLCLKRGGVDNWEWYSDTLEDTGFYECIDQIE